MLVVRGDQFIDGDIRLTLKAIPLRRQLSPGLKPFRYYALIRPLAVRGPMPAEINVFAVETDHGLPGGLMQPIGRDSSVTLGHDAAPFLPKCGNYHFSGFLSRTAQ